MSVIEHVIKIRRRLQDVTSLVKRKSDEEKEFITKWYDKSALKREFQPGDEVLVLLPSDTSQNGGSVEKSLLSDGAYQR